MEIQRIAMRSQVLTGRRWRCPCSPTAAMCRAMPGRCWRPRPRRPTASLCLQRKVTPRPAAAPTHSTSSRARSTAAASSRTPPTSAPEARALPRARDVGCPDYTHRPAGPWRRNVRPVRHLRPRGPERRRQHGLHLQPLSLHAPARNELRRLPLRGQQQHHQRHPDAGGDAGAVRWGVPGRPPSTPASTTAATSCSRGSSTPRPESPARPARRTSASAWACFAPTATAP